MEGHLNWGLPLIIDLFAAGLGAGALMVAVVADLIGRKKQFRDISLAGAFVAPWPAILGVALLVVDLGNPQRFWEMIYRRGPGLLTLEAPFLMFEPSSVMSWGTWVLSLFIVLSLCYFAAHIASFALSWVAPIRKLIGIAAFVFALPVATYTGVLISSCRIGVWNTVWLPSLFVVSAIATGIAAIIFVLNAFKIFAGLESREPNIARLEKANSGILGFQLLLVIFYVLATVGTAGGRAIIGSQFGLLFWVGIVGLGLVLPIVTGYKGKLKPEVSFAISALVLLGGFFMRYVILVAGQTNV